MYPESDVVELESRKGEGPPPGLPAQPPPPPGLISKTEHPNQCCSGRVSLTPVDGLSKGESSQPLKVYTGFSSQGRAKLRAFPCRCTAENMQLSPSLTQKPYTQKIMSYEGYLLRDGNT